MSQSKVLIIGDDPEFAQAVIARWQAERMLPELVEGDSSERELCGDCDLVILGPVNDALTVLKECDTAARPVIVIAGESNQAALRQPRPRVLVIREHEAWLDTLVVLATEVLRRLDVTSRIRKAEQALSDSEGLATLGRFMLEMRHNFNNALTSILGNSELLLLDAGTLSVDGRDQVETIHSMALRIHDILQRFSFMESELQLSRGITQGETTIPGAISLAAMTSRLSG